MVAVRRNPARLIAALAGLLALLAFSAPETARAGDLGMTQQAHAAVLGSVKGSLDATVRAYAERAAASDPRYFADGLWVNGNSTCWTCSMGASVGAAALVRDRPELVPVVVSSVDRAIAERQRANGAFYGPGNSDGIQTGWAIPVLGTIYLTIGDRVDAGTRARWAASIVAGADWLLTNRETVWYVNGNINLSYTQALWTAWKISGEPRFWTAYQASWEFTLDPPKPRWASFGLRLTTVPTKPDGSDGAGYLAESGGFDPDYAQLQLDVLSSFYAVSREPKALWLMNVLMNGVLPRVGPTFTLDARNGSRHSLLTPFMTPALSVLVASGTRPDLAPKLPGQVARVAQEYAGAITYTHPNFYRGVGTWLAVPLLDAATLPYVPAIPSPPKPSTPKPTTPKPVTPPVLPKPPAPAPAAPKPAPPTRATDEASARASSVTVSSRASVRSGALRVAVRAPAGASVRASLLCGSASCGSARAARAAGSSAVTLRVKLGRSLTRTVRRAGRRVATVVITVRAGGRTHTEHRSVWFYR